jgi:hypothetical protein
MQFHPLADLFPLLQGSEFDAFAADIKVRGLLRAIIVHEDKILDGRNRYRACLEAGVPPRTERYIGTDPLGFVISSNLRRRHLNESQRGMVAQRLAQLLAKQSAGARQKQAAETRWHGMRKRQLAPEHNGPAPLEAAAQTLNVSARTVDRAAVVARHGTPELVAAVETGQLAVSVAAQVARQSPERQLGRIKRERLKAEGKGRQGQEYYRTPAAAPESLLANERFSPCVWECACGDGAISRVLEAHGYKVISTDLHERGCGEAGVDFLKATKLLAPDIVTNAPNSLAQEFAIHALDLGVRKLALLQPLTWLAGAERYRLLWSRGKLARVWAFSPRLTLWRGDDEYAQNDGGMTDYAWFVFEREHAGAPQLDWLPRIANGHPD